MNDSPLWSDDLYVRSAVFYYKTETPFVQYVGISEMDQSINIVGVKCVCIDVFSVVFPYWLYPIGCELM